VGSIASRGGTTTSFIANPASGSGSGIGGSTNMIIPVDESGGANDNALNLGSTSTRFKDLYLSGGVFLGGTGAANKLDDYEEGTFSPTIATSGSSVSYTQQLGSYVKVGRLVSFNMSININVVTSAGSGTFEMAGLPFASASTNINNTRFVCQTSTVDFNSDYYSFYAYTPSTSVSTLRVLYTNDNGTWSVATAANFAIGNSDAIVVTGQYMTNS
jgi:hypothetical protein